MSSSMDNEIEKKENNKKIQTEENEKKSRK
jgi:hypothetical protein